MSETAVITGASSGVGKSLAIQLSDAGYRVVLAARSEDKLNAIAEEIQSKGGDSLVVSTDVSRPEQINNLKERALEYGDVSVVINNAGCIHPNRLLESDSSEWIQDISVNLVGTYLVSKYALRNNQNTLIVK